MKNTTKGTRSIKSLAQFAKETGFTRAHVYNISKRMETVELPVFAEFEGNRFEINKMKFIVIEEGVDPMPEKGKRGRPRKEK